MTKGKWFLLSGLFILSSILIQLLKLIQKFDKDKIDGFSGAFLGMGIVFFLYTLFKRNNK
jgi:hypothetical protein